MIRNHSSLGGNEVELPNFVVKEALRLLEAGVALPVFINGSAGFFVAKETDQSIQAFGEVVYEGHSYKIGTKK